MCNFYDYVSKYENLNFGKLCIFRVGFFYCTFGVQTGFLEEKFSLSRTCFIQNKVCKVGMPRDSLDKYINMLKDKNITFCIFDYTDSDIFDFEYNSKRYVKTMEYNSGVLCNFNKYSINCSNCKAKKNSIYYRLDMLEKILLSLKSDFGDKNEFK